ncbi:hypothetical protein ABIC60_004195 [Phyllobacterium ifriqiyense]
MEPCHASDRILTSAIMRMWQPPDHNADLGRSQTGCRRSRIDPINFMPASGTDRQPTKPFRSRVDSIIAIPPDHIIKAATNCTEANSESRLIDAGQNRNPQQGAMLTITAMKYKPEACSALSGRRTRRSCIPRMELLAWLRQKNRRLSKQVSPD